MTSLQILAEQVGASERTLRRAVNAGALRAERTSPRKLQMSTAEKRFVRASWPMLAKLREVLRTEHNVRFALLFGSAARGDDSEDSDLDILVEMRDSSFDRQLDLAIKLGRLLGREIDLVDFAQAESNADLLASAIGEGRVIVDRDGRWPAMKAREQDLIRRAEVERSKQVSSALAAIDRMLER